MFFKLSILYYLLKLKTGRFFYGNNIAKLQKKRFNALKKELLKSPFYHKQAQLDLGLADFPPMNKAAFMKNFDTSNTRGLRLEKCMDIAKKAEASRDFSPMIDGITIGLSTGTSGNRGVFLASTKERAKWVASILDRVIGFELKKRKVAFFLRANSNLYETVNSNLLSFNFFDIMGDLDVNLKELNQLQPQIIVAQPSMLLLLAEAQKNKTIRIKPDKIISVAEVLTEEDKNELMHVFKQIIHQVYQCTEGFLAATCKEGNLHFNEDFIKVDKRYLDESKNRFHPIITDLWRTTQPVIHYELNDIITTKDACACGSKMMAIERIEGRSDDILIFERKDETVVKLFPDFMRRTIVLSNEQIEDYTVIQKSKNLIELYIKGEQELFIQAKEALLKMLATHHVVNVEIIRIINDPFVMGTKKRRVRNESK